MGQQIQVAQSPTDEARINEILVAKFDLLSLPWTFRAPAPAARPPGGHDVDIEILFGRQFAGLLLDHIEEVDESDGLSHVDRSLCVYIEWSRTERLKRKGYVAGRYYLDTVLLNQTACRRGRIWKEAAAHTKSIMAFILRHIKKTYPKRSDEQYPIYAGPDLVERIDRGEAILYYLNQRTVVELQPVPR